MLPQAKVSLAARFARLVPNVRVAYAPVSRSHRRGGRVVECTGLENRRPFTRTVGSNPTPSASRAERDSASGWNYGGHTLAFGCGCSGTNPTSSGTRSATRRVGGLRRSHPRLRLRVLWDESHLVRHAERDSASGCASAGVLSAFGVENLGTNPTPSANELT